MIASTYLGFAAVALASFASASVVEQDWVVALLKRQEPGTPLYACHDKCGSSITLSRGGDPCKNSAFSTAYEYCLTCAGPDKLNIWRYYGTTLTAAGTKCGFSTTPGVPSESKPEPASTTTPAAPSPTPIATTSAPPAETPSTTSSTSSAAGTSSGTPVPQTTSVSVSVSPVPTSSATIKVTPTSSVVIPSATIPAGTASSGLPTSAAPQFTGAANAQHVVGLGALAAAVFALLI